MKITVTIDLGEQLERIESSLTRLHTKADSIMAEEKDVETLLDALNVATNNVAAKIDSEQKQIEALQAQIQTGQPVSQAQLDSIASRLGTLKTTLEGLAADAANPVPGDTGGGTTPPVDDNPPVPGTVG